jgi:acyl-coenzyme A synthetase/AMP-(fatty) acid ligase
MNMQPLGRWKQFDNGRLLDAAVLQHLSQRVAWRLSALSVSHRSLAFAGLQSELGPAVVFGAWSAGWSIAPLRSDAPEDMRQEMLRQLGSEICISQDIDGLAIAEDARGRHPFEQWLGSFSAQPENVETASAKIWSADETAAVLFTSGSSGRPKGVTHSQCNMLRAAALFAEHFGLAAGETLACLAPPHTASGLRSMLLPLVAPVDVALWPREAGHMAETFDALAKIDPQVLLCGPRFVSILAAAGKRARRMLPSLRLVASTGAALSEKDRAAVMRELGVEVLDFYGLSETGGIVLAERPGSPTPGFLPPACKGVDVRLAPMADRPDVFELEIQGPNVFLGYLHEPRYRRSVFATGDLVHRRGDGSLTMIGRRDRSFKGANTEWVYPERLQAWLCKQTPVRDAHVEALPEVIGEGLGLLATLEIEDGVDPPNLTQWLAKIARELGSEYAQVQLMLGAVQRSALGKIQKA